MWGDSSSKQAAVVVEEKKEEKEKFSPAEGQYVQLLISSKQTEIAKVVSARGPEVVVESSAGYVVKTTREKVKRAFLIILDLNGVLMCRRHKGMFIPRPHLDDFLAYCLNNFIVGVWSSCIETNGRQILDQVFKDRQRRLAFTFFRDQCTPAATAEKPFATLKNLQRVWDKFPESFNEGNTVIIDDSPEKCTHPQNALCPLGYGCEDPADEELLRLKRILQQTLEEDSLRAVREERPPVRPPPQQQQGPANPPFLAAAVVAPSGGFGLQGVAVGGQARQVVDPMQLDPAVICTVNAKAKSDADSHSPGGLHHIHNDRGIKVATIFGTSPPAGVEAPRPQQQQQQQSGVLQQLMRQLPKDVWLQPQGPSSSRQQQQQQHQHISNPPLNYSRR